MQAMATVPDRFRDLLTDFCAAHQMPVDAQALGVEFEAEGYRVLMASDPRDPDRMLVDVVVGALNEPSHALLRVLHQLNHGSRTEHNWVVSLDLNDQLCLHTQCDLGAVRVEDVQSILVEGIDRAEALDNLRKNLAEVPSMPEDAQLSAAGELSQLVRV